MIYVFTDLLGAQGWSAQCVTTPKVKSQEQKPYLGASHHEETSHAQVYPSVIIDQCVFATDNAFVQCGNRLAKQKTLAQGEHGSPLAAQCTSVMYVDLKHTRLRAMIAAGVPGHTMTDTLTRVTRILTTCVAQLMDDIATLAPYFTDDPESAQDIVLALSEIYHSRPILTGVPTFPAPLELEQMTSDQ